MRVLFVVPLAAHTGHPPGAAMYEPMALAKNGVDVTLLTFCGIHNGCKAAVPEIRIVDFENHLTLKRLADSWRTKTLTQWGLRGIEVSTTLNKAISLRNEFDVIHLRDGEPFLFAPHLMSLAARTKWLISLMGGNLSTVRSSKEISEGKFMSLYRFAFNTVVNNKGWKLVYNASHRLNKVRYITQDDQTRAAYVPYFGEERIVTVPLGTYTKTCAVTRRDARQRLGLPDDKLVLLLFGVPHAGKNNRVVFEAVSYFKDVYLVCAGDSSMSLGQSPAALAEEFKLDDRVRIFNRFIDEEEKPIFFKAANASILSYTRAFDSTSSMLWDSCSYGTPVIASDANTLGQLAKQNQVGLLFKAEDKESLIMAIHSAKGWLNGYGNIAAAYEAQCNKFSEDYSLDRWAKRMQEVYAEY